MLNMRMAKYEQNMRNEENICQYCTKLRAITTSSLNLVEIKCSKSYLTYLLIT